MIRSMTGYSRAQEEDKEFTLAVSVKGTNHRFLDLQMRLPAGLDSLEPLLRSMVKERAARGHIEVQISLERVGQSELHLDRKMLEAHLRTIQELRREFAFSGEPDLVALLRIPGMITSANGEIGAEQFQRLQDALSRTARIALDRLDEMKVREGESLARDLRTRLDRLRSLGTSVEKLAREVPAFYSRRLERRLQEVLGSSSRHEVDEARLAQEVAFLASRSDITEELTRFQSHLDQIQNLGHDTYEVGKKLDFLLQEMNREANTILSKTTDVPEVGLEITRQAIEMKAEIEKLREQAQNIE